MRKEPICMKDYPHVLEEEGSVAIEFAPGAEQSNARTLKMVLDFGQWGEVVGIEIISLIFAAGKDCLQIIDRSLPTQGEGLRYAYDEESDCFYLRLKTGRSCGQRSVTGSMLLDADGRITSLGAKW